ncbi:MAG: hypothetical protein WAZ94_15065 [Phycisphaerales bacterium]|nr:hypothetical protein [Chloroflexota bacterium]
MSAVPRSTPPGFYDVTSDAPIGETLSPVDPVIPAASPESIGRDAALPAGEAARYQSAMLPWAQVASAWRLRIETEALADVQIRHYRTPTRQAPLGLHLRPFDGALLRRPDREALAYTQRAWAQLIALLLQEVPNKPKGAAEPYRFLGPEVRAQVFAHLRDRSRRREGNGHEVLLRSFVDPRFGLRALRAVVSGRHSGVHFDDLALIHALRPHVRADGLSSCVRGIDETHGQAVIESSGDVRAMIYWHNSETGAASLGFGAGCYVTALDSIVANGRIVTTERGIEEHEVSIISARGSTRRAHTLPRARQTEEDRARIAQARMQADIKTATDESRELCRAWGDALKEFPTTQGAWSEAGASDRETASQVVLDLIEEHTRGFTEGDRTGLLMLLKTEGRLRALPFASAAHIAGAWAVLASKQTNWDEARRMQAEAGRWVTQGFRRGGR